MLSHAIQESYADASDNVRDVQTKEVVRRRIAMLIVERAIKIRGFAMAAGRSTSWASMFLRGKRKFSFDRIDEVAAFFQHRPEAIIAPLTPDEVKRSDDALKRFPQRRHRPTVRAVKRAVASLDHARP